MGSEVPEEYAMEWLMDLRSCSISEESLMSDIARRDLTFTELQIQLVRELFLVCRLKTLRTDLK